MGCFDESDQQKNNRAYHAVSGFDNSPATPDSVQVKDSGNLHTLYFKDGGKSEKVVAIFLNSASGESEEVEMTKCGEDSDSRTFSCEGDVRKYNVASFDCNGQKTRKVAFNPCVSGWYKSKNGWMPYTQGKETAYVPSFEQVILDCNGYEKKIYFWTPDGYDPNSDEKYATIYVDQVRSMIQNTGYKAIVVAVSTYGNMTDIIRDDEQIPDIGECETVGDVLYHAGVPGAVRNGRRSVALVLA